MFKPRNVLFSFVHMIFLDTIKVKRIRLYWVIMFCHRHLISMLSVFTCFKIDVRVTSIVYKSVKLGKNQIKYVYMCITRSERVCDKGLIKREWLFIICVTFSSNNSPDIRLLCLIICYLCFWFVFKILFSSIHCVCIFYFVPHFSTIILYYLYVHLFMCINMYTHGHIANV